MFSFTAFRFRKRVLKTKRKWKSRMKKIKMLGDKGKPSKIQNVARMLGVWRGQPASKLLDPRIRIATWLQLTR